MNMDWNDPIDLKKYRSAPNVPGVYVIGKQSDKNLPVMPSNEYNAYLGKWPDNLFPLYVGISENKKTGMRGRLSCHARGKGSKGIARYIARGEDLWFISLTGIEMIELESMLLLLKTSTQFECNIRDELDRSSVRRTRKLRAEMGEDACAYYDNLDMGEHGEGM